MSAGNNHFKFEISLSVLNHLGRNLYRNFSTVVGEAVSNAWDADAKNVYIYVDSDNAVLLIKDDGIGMSSADFQEKFLKIGYSKRKTGETKSPSGRPFIGRKGIGKLALLSCASKIAIITKSDGASYVGGIIDNSELDRAITNDLTPDEYSLEVLDESRFAGHMDGHNHGTIIFFENIKDGIRNSLDNLKKTIALYFRFSLIDDSFNIYVEDELVDIECLNDLIANTQFLWKLNELHDPYIHRLEEVFGERNEISQLDLDTRVKGFVASVRKPRQLNIIGTGEQVKVDLFVNGRLRERDILRHIPTARVTESYLYGQIHFDVLDDDGEDRFTSSREGVIANDPLLGELLKIIREDIMRDILVDWDKWRRKHKEDGDSEDSSISLKDRKSGELFNAIAGEYKSHAAEDGTTHQVDQWVQDLSEDARFSFTSYAECYVGENLLRRYIENNSVILTDRQKDVVADCRGQEITNKAAGNININIRKIDNDLSYLDMTTLSKVVDETDGTNNLLNDSKQYKPMRDALMHTALLSEEAKLRLTTVFDNIKARIKTLL